MITIVSPVYIGQSHRVQYHKHFLSCCKNLKNFDDIKFIFFYEQSILDKSLVEELYKYKNIDVHINSYRFGTFLNQYNCLNYCFEHLKLDHAIYLEDDVDISNDIYDITNFYVNSSHFADNNIFCYLNKDNLFDNVNTRYDLIEIKNFMRGEIDRFTPWGFLATKNIWNYVLKHWDKRISFDWEIVKACKDDYKIVTPQESRVNHIGVNGMNYNNHIFKAHNFAAYNVKQYTDEINYSYV
jgi:hypothetical protein